MTSKLNSLAVIKAYFVLNRSLLELDPSTVLLVWVLLRLLTRLLKLFPVMAWWKISVFIGFVTAAVLRRLLRHSRKCPSAAFMNGKTVIITGANNGLGRAAAFELARRKARLILACRSLLSAQETAGEIKASTGNGEIIPKELDLASLRSVREFCREILAEEAKIDVLINNAGIYQCPYMRTENGFEMQMGVNHLGHFLLTSLLLERIKASAPSRIVIVSSSLCRRGSIKFDDIHSELSYDKRKGYADSKLANLLHARELSKRLAGTGVDVFPYHPGMVVTKLGRHVVSSFTLRFLPPILVMLGVRDADEGCQSLVYSAVAEELIGKSGIYIDKNCKPSQIPPSAMDDEVAKKLWELSENLTRVYSEL